MPLGGAAREVSRNRCQEVVAGSPQGTGDVIGPDVTERRLEAGFGGPARHQEGVQGKEGVFAVWAERLGGGGGGWCTVSEVPFWVGPTVSARPLSQARARPGRAGQGPGPWGRGLSGGTDLGVGSAALVQGHESGGGPSWEESGQPGEGGCGLSPGHSTEEAPGSGRVG